MKRLAGFLAVVIAISALVVFVQRYARLHGRFRGLLYRLSGQEPDPDVDDLTLADRIRSELGPVEKRLDLPRVHVMVREHVALLHGQVEWPHEAATVEAAVRRVSGVRDIESHLHVGFLDPHTRPSAGHHDSTRRVGLAPSATTHM